MKARINDTSGLEIAGIATCDFGSMIRLDNTKLLRDVLCRDAAPRVERFIEDTMGARERYHCPADMNAIDLARQAVARLLECSPGIASEIDFIIFAGISSPRPVTTVSALLACEFGLSNASCWDLKSGCSTGILALIQAHGYIAHGARGGLIVCAETLSKFTDPAILQMAASVGDGAVAVHVKASNTWRLRGIVHGTNPRHANSMSVPGCFPVDPSTYDPKDYLFHFEGKPEGIEALGEAWVRSLSELIEVSEIDPKTISHYVAHQVDAMKNAVVPDTCGIPEASVAKCFARYGNMGCPTVFVNYAERLAETGEAVRSGGRLVFHAVGGGLSWAAACIDVA